MTREEKVAFFNRIMNQIISGDAKNVSLQDLQLGIGLIFEELEETADASGVPATFNKLCLDSVERRSRKSIEVPVDTGIVDVPKQLDGLCDLQYTTSWCINVFGHSGHFEEGFDIVCDSNNSKACSTRVEAEQTVEYWENKEGEDHFYEEVDLDGEILYVVKRLRDKKVRKSIKYKEVDFSSIFDKEKA